MNFEQLGRSDTYSIGTILALAAIGAATQCLAQYPVKPIQMTVSSAPGAGTDLVGRTVADKLAERLGVPVIVANNGGAAGLKIQNHLACDLDGEGGDAALGDSMIRRKDQHPRPFDLGWMPTLPSCQPFGDGLQPTQAARGFRQPWLARARGIGRTFIAPT